MSPGGLAAFEQLHIMLTTTLLLLAALAVGLLGLSAAGSAMGAVCARSLRRRRTRGRDAWVHAEAVRGIAELDRYLRRWDATR